MPLVQVDLPRPPFAEMGTKIRDAVSTAESDTVPAIRIFQTAADLGVRHLIYTRNRSMTSVHRVQSKTTA